MVTQQQRSGGRAKLDISTTVALVLALIFFIGNGYLSFLQVRIMAESSDDVARTHEVIKAQSDLLTMLIDAETGQRGYILTGNENYLLPYTRAMGLLTTQMNLVESLLDNRPEQKARIPAMRGYAEKKAEEMAAVLELRRTQGLDAAVERISVDVGRQAMDALRAEIQEMQKSEQERRLVRVTALQDAYRSAVLMVALAAIVGVVLACSIAYLLRQAAMRRQAEEWLLAGHVGLAGVMAGDQRADQLGENILRFMAEFLGAQVGAFFIEKNGVFERAATYGVPADARVPAQFRPGEGLLGQAALDKRAFLVQDLPEEYLRVGSALGGAPPRHLMVAAAVSEGATNAVFELGFVKPWDKLAEPLLERVAEMIGVALRAANYRSHLQDLLEETQRQSEELQAQSEELRVSNEELEEQSRALKESQTRLEQQQAELEQTNAQLEEQTQLLETQKDDLERAKSTVQAKARELEQASQYKSDFLANMSHELRTPLNSSLILAKLLADNPEGNLTAEQVKFATTIQNSGNDLLSLINDILDLSKIEAGHMEVRPERVTLERLTRDMQHIFDEMARERGLAFNIEIAADCPKTMMTDRQRLEQILKNLLSNAFKFTERGAVTLSLRMAGDDRIAFAVRDSGIGIAPEQQAVIFEAFRQADGTISRKYGGTGLGLSISRQLTRLLGGVIELESEMNVGSCFTITLPLTYDAERVVPLGATGLSGPVSSAMGGEEEPVQDTARGVAEYVRGQVPDDREKLVPGARKILVVEDDEAFAGILYEMAHEVGFMCLVATSAEEALAVAADYEPDAVLLDIGLPDNSGLTVLDRLKRDGRTRHIPVHVVSANDYTATALSLGAVGYMIKPVKRDELVGALKGLEERLAQRVRRVLVVEDDEVQRQSIDLLLGSGDVETVGVGTAAECLERLKTEHFDCMVLDLSLPDATGYGLLQTLSEEEAYSFPPVIVYTGRDLSAEEERRLRRYSRSIIIKGAKSPERLLDEVTLFLHQVVAELPPERQKMLEKARHRDAVLEGRRVLVVEDDVANIFALTSILEPQGVVLQFARNGREALTALEEMKPEAAIDLVLMDMMMPEMDGITATKLIRQNAAWRKLPIIMLTAKAMRNDQQRCLEAGANDYMAKPLDVEKLLSLVRVWMPR